MKRFLLALLALVSVPALAQTIYLQGSQTPGQLAPPTAGIPATVQGTGAVNIYSTSGCRLVHTGGAPNTSATSANTNQTPVITEVYIAEILVVMPCTATGVAVYNGSAVAGNAKVGLASATGAVLATSASTATSGTTTYQRIPFTGTIDLAPGRYYVLTFYDNAAQRPTAWTAGSFGTAVQTGQTFATGFTTITPPTTFTTAVGPVASLY